MNQILIHLVLKLITIAILGCSAANNLTPRKRNIDCFYIELHLFSPR